MPPVNLQVYDQADVALDKLQPFDLDASVGLNLTGGIPFRPSVRHPGASRHATCA